MGTSNRSGQAEETPVPRPAPAEDCQHCGSSKHASEECYVFALVVDLTITPEKGSH